MKNLRYSSLLRSLFSAAALLFSAIFATGCYQAQEAGPGTVSLNAVSGARSLLLGAETANVWVVGLVIDGSFEPKLKELLAQEDLRKATDGSLDASKDLWLDLAIKSTVKFDGGRPFFQYSMPRINAATGATTTGSFTIAGIPANKAYFLYLMVLPNPLASISDFTDDPLALSPIHYFDPATAPDDITIRTSSTGSLINLTAGWYSFSIWEPAFDLNNQWSGLTATVWTDVSGKPISSQPFIVSPGESVPVSVLLTDFQP